jgi:glycosyltransferase involved in cell wall biosynthesis
MVSSILFLGSQMTVGGAQRVLFNQAEWFFEKGYEVITAFFYDKENLKEQWDSAYPFPVIDLCARRLRANRVTNFFLLVAGMFRLWNLLRKNEFDVIETFTPDSNLLGLLVARLKGVPVRIASHHGYIEGTPVWRKLAHGWMINNGFAHVVVAVSESVRRIAIDDEGIRPDLVKVILNGIEPVRPSKPPAQIRTRLQNELGLKPGDFIYLSVGRLTLQKGHTYLLDAVTKVLARFPSTTVFIIAGEGHQRENLEKKAVDLGVEKIVHFLGNRSDVSDLLSISDVFVLPSLSEGLPLALLEAMGAGLPVVSTRVGGVESVISDGENGYLLPSKDVDALSSALIKIRDDVSARQAFGRRNAALVQREFTNDQMCIRYEKIFLIVYQQETA